MSIGAFGENFPYSNFHELNMDWIISIIKDFKEQYPDIIEELDKKINKPDDDTIGGLLKNLGNGQTEWVDIGDETAEIIYDAVNEWLNEHPEATTTVEDDSLTTAKLVPSFRKNYEHIMSYESFDVYVDPVNGVDDSEHGTNGSPYKTIQYAYDSLPVVLDKRCTIHLASGIYSENYRDMSNNKHPAILFADNKATLQKTDTRYDGEDHKYITSALEIIGDDGAIIETTDDLPYGFYISNYIHLGITNLTFRPNSNEPSEHMIDCNRTSYIHMTRVTISGNNNCRFGIYVEAGSWAEIAQFNRIEGCTYGLFINPHCRAIFSGTITNTNTTGISNSGYCYIYDTSIINAPIYSGMGSSLTIRGNGAEAKAVVTEKITVETNSTLQAIYATLGHVEILDGSTGEFLQTDFSNTCLLMHSLATFRGVTVNTVSPYAIDITDSTVVFRGTNSFNSANSVILATMKSLILTESGTTTLESTNSGVSAIKLYTQSQSIVTQGATLTSTLSRLLQYNTRELEVTPTNCTISSGKITDIGDAYIFDIIITTTDTGAYINIPIELTRTKYIMALDPYNPSTATSRICTVSSVGKVTPYQNNNIPANTDILITGVVAK